MNRAYSLITVKAVDEDKRILSGIATTPTPDRMSDVVEPKGAEFKLPIPFLWQHDSAQPIGHVTKAKVGKDGIEVEIKLAKTDEPGRLKDRLDEAWQSIRAGLVRGLSIGFKALEFSRLEDGGLRFIKWAWLELSAVTIPANAEATITAIKSAAAPYVTGSKGAELFIPHDDSQATQRHSRGVVRLTPPGASGFPNPNRQETKMKTYQEQIKEWEATRAAKVAAMEALMSKTAESGESLDEAQGQEYDGLKREVENIDKHLVRLNDMAKTVATKAVPVSGASPEDAAVSRGGARVQVINEKLDKGIGFTRFALCMAQAGGNISLAQNIAKYRYPEYAPLQSVMKGMGEMGKIDLGLLRKSSDNMDFLRKAAVAGGTTSDTNWATSLVNYQDLANEFVEYLRPRTIIGQFGTGNIPSLRRVPFNIRVPRATSKASGYWTGEGKGKPLTKFNTEQITLDFHKVATIAAITKELARFSNPSAEALVRDELAKAVIERIDIDFVDPDKTASAGVSPASITNGATNAASAGDTAANVRTDIQTLFGEFIQANIPLTGAVFIMNANVALALSMMMNDLGQPEFPSITMNGGTLVGLPVLVSQYVDTALLILAAADEIYLADDGNVSIDVSEEASLEMLDGSLTQDGTAGTGASLVSLWQTNMLGIRAEREITWLKRRTEAVAYITSFNPGGTAGSGDI